MIDMGLFGPDQEHQYISALMRSILADSGLTVDQIGRLFGVSARSIYSWMAGSRVSLRHSLRARDLRYLIDSLDGTTPQERKTELLRSSAGTSLYRHFMEETPKDQRIHY